MTKTVLITGSTDGLGKAVAERLARQDWKILLHGRSEDKGTAVLAELRELTGNDDIYYFNADLSSLADTKRLADEILATQKRLDVLINNAGIGPRAPDSIRSLSKDGNELFLSVNYLAGYLLARQLLPLLSKSAPSRVINVASIAQVPSTLTISCLTMTTATIGLTVKANWLRLFIPTQWLSNIRIWA